MISREAFLSNVSLPVEKVELPELEDHVFVRMLTAAERDKFSAGCVDMSSDQMASLRARFVCLCACDSDGKRLFKDKDVDAVGGQSPAVIDRMFEAAQRLNGLDEDAIEVAEGN